jgi:hypothetical protein
MAAPWTEEERGRRRRKAPAREESIALVEKVRTRGPLRAKGHLIKLPE